MVFLPVTHITNIALTVSWTKAPTLTLPLELSFVDSVLSSIWVNSEWADTTSRSCSMNTGTISNCTLFHLALEEIGPYSNCSRNSRSMIRTLRINTIQSMPSTIREDMKPSWKEEDLMSTPHQRELMKDSKRDKTQCSRELESMRTNYWHSVME